jgi:outer membrane biosynthesis protein TonB
MHEVVSSNLHSKLFGKGLPEQMRSTAFVFLGLTAAAALTLVAIFAQLGFPLLSPVPLPTGPAEKGRIGDGVALAGERVGSLRRAVATPAVSEPVARGPEERSEAGEAVVPPASGGGAGDRHSAGEVATPAPSPIAPPKAPPQPPPSADPPDQSPPAASPEPVPAPNPPPAASPAPSPPPPAPTPPPPAAQPPAAPVAAAASPPAHSNAGGNGKGNAYGHTK